MKHNQTKPLVSIITPVYNREDFIEETILSVLGQDYPNIEYIVIDDGSTDKSLEIIKKYKNKLIWKTQKNQGEAKTVNRGFKMAKGEFVSILSSDDTLMPNTVSSIHDFFVNHPDIAIVYPDWRMIDSGSRKIKNVKTPNYSYLDMLRWHACFPGAGTFIKKEIIQKLKGRDPQFKYVGDYDFWLRAGLVGKFARIPKVLANYRVHDNSATVNLKGRQMAQEHIRVINKIYSLPKLSTDIKKIKNEALSSANFTAAIASGNGISLLKIWYTIKAFGHKPTKYLGEYKYRTLGIFYEILAVLFKIKNPYKNKII